MRAQADYSVDLSSPVLRDLLGYWRSLTADARIPTRADVDPQAMRPWLPHVMLVDVQFAPRRFRWRLIGTHVTQTLGRDVTGRWFDELYDPPILTGMCEAYSHSVDRRAPVRFTGRADFAHKTHVAFESLHMPLVDAGDRVNMLLAGAVIALSRPEVAPTASDLSSLRQAMPSVL